MYTVQVHVSVISTLLANHKYNSIDLQEIATVLVLLSLQPHPERPAHLSSGGSSHCAQDALCLKLPQEDAAKPCKATFHRAAVQLPRRREPGERDQCDHSTGQCGAEYGQPRAGME